MNNKYTIIKQESIEELNGTGYILKHDKTGARVVVISNEDDNKVFQIGFRGQRITEYIFKCNDLSR